MEISRPTSKKVGKTYYYPLCVPPLKLPTFSGVRPLQGGPIKSYTSKRLLINLKPAVPEITCLKDNNAFLLLSSYLLFTSCS